MAAKVKGQSVKVLRMGFQRKGRLLAEASAMIKERIYGYFLCQGRNGRFSSKRCIARKTLR